jgi:hypothetical protein
MRANVYTLKCYIYDIFKVFLINEYYSIKLSELLTNVKEYTDLNIILWTGWTINLSNRSKVVARHIGSSPTEREIFDRNSTFCHQIHFFYNRSKIFVTKL